ncbi:hypothetical protein [Gimesia panareensis]|uniref:hypothetical protein n=1 Tax=Gimesia panareensis TaxID=2527978 RepID=UPI00118C6BEC|nr:hypothetical protein [Gimesia panareensis]QDU49639.1 hypothetical protein Pan110_19770 [Gimesia panareensis]
MSENWDFSAAHRGDQFDTQLALIALPGSEAQGLIDLWTVMCPELGHLLKQGAVVERMLDPGRRKLSDWSEETDDFLA